MGDVEHRSVRYRKKALPERVWRTILQREQRKIFGRYASAFPPDPGQRILDLGVSASLDRPEQYFFEYHHPHRSRIVAAGLESGELVERCFPEVEYVQVARDEGLPFEDLQFDIVFCSAVIEHVGSRAVQRAFLEEALRVGRNLFLTTPNRWFPIELHTALPLVHYLPTPVYRRLFRLLGFDFFSDEANLNLLDARSLMALVPDRVKAQLRKHRLFGLTSNLLLVVDRDGGTMRRIRA